MVIEWIWKRLTISGTKRNNVPCAHYPPVETDVAHAIPVERRWPLLQGAPMVIADAVPASERISWLQEFILQTVLRLKEYIGITAAYPEPWNTDKDPYYPEYEELYPRSKVPEDFLPGADRVAGIARRGPFSIVTKRSADGAYEIDVSHVAALEPRKGVLRAGGRARLVREGDVLKTDYIELDGKQTRPGDPGWALTEKRFLTGLASHTTFIEHLIRCHMCVAEALALATIEALPFRHPLRSLIQPFIVETFRVNDDNIDGLIKTENSNVPSYSGYPLKTVSAMITAVARGFQFQESDPEFRATAQGTLEPMFPTVMANVELYRMFRKMTSRYVDEVLGEVSLETATWVRTLDAHVPNGVRGLVGIQEWSELTKEHVAHILATALFVVSVNHHLVADLPRDYMLQFTVMPPCVWEDGYPTRGQVLEKLNSITIAGILRYRLVADDVQLSTPKGAAIWADFQSDLKAIQARVDATDAAQRRFLIHPKLVPSSIHA